MILKLDIKVLLIIHNLKINEVLNFQVNNIERNFNIYAKNIILFD